MKLKIISLKVVRYIHSWRHASHFIFHRFHSSLPPSPTPSFLPRRCILYSYHVRDALLTEPPSRRMTVRLLRAVRGALLFSRAVPSSFTGVAPSVHLLNSRQISKNAGTQTTNFKLWNPFWWKPQAAWVLTNLYMQGTWCHHLKLFFFYGCARFLHWAHEQCALLCSMWCLIWRDIK